MNNLALQQQNVLGDLDTLDRIERFAKLMASSRSTIPIELQDNPGDCLAIALQSAAWQMNPFAVAQKSHVIKGKLGYESQLVNAVITRHAPIEGRLQFHYSEGWEKILGRYKTVQGQNGPYSVSDWSPAEEKGLWCEVSATMKGEADPRVTRMLLVQAQPRQSTQWATDPKQQLAYATIKRWARLHCPDVILGIYTPDELEHREYQEKDITPEDKIRAQLKAHGEPLTARKDGDLPTEGIVIDLAEGEEAPARTAKDSPVQRTPIEHTAETTQEVSDPAERHRELLRRQGQVPIAEPTDQDHETLKMAVDSIRSCNSAEQLDQCRQDLTNKIHPDLKDQAIKVFKEKQKALKS